MCITFKKFTQLIAEGKQAYTSENDWNTAAGEVGYKVKKLSGDASNKDQTWGAFNEKDEKVGEFSEQEEGGWLIEGQINEIFGIFRNNEKKQADRDKLKKDTADMVDQHRAKQAAKQNAQQAEKNGKGKGNDVEDDDEEEDDRRKKTTSPTRSGSTKGTRTTQSAAQGRAAERDWVKNS